MRWWAAFIALALISAAFITAGAATEYIVSPRLVKVEIADRSPVTFHRTDESFGGVYTLSVTGMGNPIYGRGIFLLLNETGEVRLKIEVVRGPSSFRFEVKRIRVHPEWCYVHFELSEKRGAPVRVEPLEVEVGRDVTAESPLVMDFAIKPYAFKEEFPYGGVERCTVYFEVYGNATFGKNFEEWWPWSLGVPVYVLNPEEPVDVEIRKISLRLEVGADYYPREGFLSGEVRVRNNLAGDVVLKELEVKETRFLGAGTSSYHDRIKVDAVLRPGQSKNVRFEEKWYCSPYDVRTYPNGSIMIALHYLSEKGEGVKRFLYFYDLKRGEWVPPTTGVTRRQTRSQATATGGGGAPSRPSAGPRLVDELYRLLQSPVTALIILAIALSVAGLVAVARPRPAPSGAARPTPPPPPSPPPPKLKELPRHVYGECLKIMEGKLQEYRDLKRGGKSRYALYALHDGLEAALKEYAKGAGVITADAEKWMTLGDVLRILSDHSLISGIENRMIRQVMEVRNRYKHRKPTAEPKKHEVDNCGIAYEVVLSKFRSRYGPLPPQSQQ